MWACRSRPRVLLLSQLHAVVRRRVNEAPFAFVLGGGGGSRRLVSDASSDGDRRDDALVHRGRAQCDGGGRQKKQFLYLVLDDVKKGCSVHKLDIEPTGDVKKGRLPGSPVFRMEYPTLGDGDDQYVAVLGSNIVGISTGSQEPFNGFCNGSGGGGGVTVAFDIKTAALNVLRGLPYGMQDCHVDLAVAVGGTLCLFPDQGQGRRMHHLELEEEDEEDVGRWRWCDYGDRDPPFLMNGVPDHALHPAGHAFFVSLFYCCAYRDRDLDRWDPGPATFSYDAERGKWTHHGDWHLPFQGQAHYDRHLAAWIGLHLHPQYHRDHDLDTDGYLCCCDVPPLPLTNPAPPPRWKLSKDKLFVLDTERHIDAKLVPMGGDAGQFCLVEILTHEGVDRKGCLGDGHKCLLRLTTFRVSYGDGGGELTITDRRPAGEYRLSRYVDGFQAQAFWM